MRVLMLTPDFPPARGGTQHVSGRLAEHLLAQTTVVTLRRDGSSEETKGVRRVRALREQGPLAIGALNAAALQTALRQRPDVLLSMHLFTAPAARAARRLLGRPWVQYAYAMEIAQKPGLARMAFSQADVVVAISEYSRQLVLNAGAPADRVCVIPPGVDLTPPAPRDRGRPRLITVARLAERYKGHDVVLRALPLVRARVPDVEWVVVGDGPLRPALEARAEGLPVRFVGSVTDVERDAWLGRSHVLVMPSRLPGGGGAGEGFGIVFLEAGVHGLPVVAGGVGGALDAVLDGETGLLVDPDDHVAVAGALVRLLTDPGLADRMGQAGAAHAARSSWSSVAERLHDVIERVAA